MLGAMILNGWTEIADYLRCSVRTVQRYERQGLPVLRPVPGSRSHVVAYSDDLDRWLKRSEESIPRIPRLQAEIEHTQQLLLELSQQRRQMYLRIEELRKKLTSLRAMYPKRRKK